MLPFGSKPSVVGLDVTATAAKVVKLQPAKGGPRVTAYGMTSIPEGAIDGGLVMRPDLVAEAISQSFLTAGINAKKASVVSCLSANQVFIRQISVPRMSMQELENAMQWEAERYVPFDISEALISFDLPAPGLDVDPESEDVKAELDVVLVAAKKQAVEAFLSTLSLAGVKPKVLEVNIFALPWVGKLRQTDGPSLEDYSHQIENLGLTEVGIGYLDVGPDYTNLFITCDDEYRISRTTSVGVIRLTGEPEVTRNSQLDPGAFGELIHELHRNIDYYSKVLRGFLSVLYLTGEGARINGLREQLESELDTVVQILQPIRETTVDRSKVDKEEMATFETSLSVAIGLALRGLDRLG